MRRWWLAVLVLSVFAALGVAWWHRDEPLVAEAQQQSASPNEGRLPRALLASKWNAPVVEHGKRSVKGVVLRAGAPVAGAAVTAVAAHGQDVLSDLPCQCDNHCGQKLLACGCAEASGQLVELVGARTGEGAPLGRATTDATGAFEISGLDETVLTLWADAPEGVAWRTDLASDAADVRLEMKPGRVLRGKVTKTDGTPAANALVTAIFAEQSRFFDVVADGQGAFRTGTLPAGKYAVVAMQAGLLPDHVTVRDDSDESLALELSVPRTLSGTVVREGAPVAGATVKLEGMHRKRSVVTDAQGAFQVERLRPGHYELAAESGSGLAAASTTISKHEDRTGVVLTLGRGVSVTGLVTDARGSALAGVALAISEKEDWRRATSDEQGKFALPVVSEGKHWLWASKRGYLKKTLEISSPEANVVLEASSVLSGRVVNSVGGRLVTPFSVKAWQPRDAGAGDDEFNFERPVAALPGNEDSEDSTDGGFALDLNPGRYQLRVSAPPWAPVTLEATAPGNLTVTLKPGAKVRGRVVDLEGAPAAGARVSCSGPEFSSRASSDAEGRFVIEGLSAGRYALVASKSEENVQLWTARAEVSVREAETVEVELRPKPGAPIAGVVISAKGEPVPGVKIMGWNGSTDGGYQPSATGAATTDAEGHFRLRSLLPGPVTLYATPQGGSNVSARAIAPDEKIIIKLGAGTTVSGRVLGEGGKVLKSFSFMSQPIDSQDGRFEVPARPGKDTLGIDAEGYAQHIFEVELKTGPNDLGDIVMTRGRAVSGVVTDAKTQRPVEGALVDVGVGEPKGEPRLEEELGAVRTDAAGRYKLPAVDPASSWLSVTHPASWRVASRSRRS